MRRAGIARALDRPAFLRPDRWARLGIVATIAASWLLLLVAPTRGWLDFSSFYAAGRLVFTPSILDLDSILGLQRAHGLPLVPFLYPPAFALLYVPFTWLPYGWSAAIHLVLQTALLVAAAVVGSRVFAIPIRVAVLGALAWMPAAIGVITGQNSALLLLLVVWSAAALRAADVGGVRGPLSQSAASPAGIALGAAAYRPHLGLPLVLLALWRGARSAFLIALAVITMQYLLGVVATGGVLDWPIVWVSTIGTETITDFTSAGWQVIGLPGLLSRIAPIGSTESSGLYVAGLTVGIGLVIAMRDPLRRWDAPSAIALACALALFGGPRGWAYDATLLLPGLAVIARNGRRLDWPFRHRLVLVGAYGLALATPLGALVNVNPTAVVVLAMPLVLYWLGRGEMTQTATLAITTA